MNACLTKLIFVNIFGASLSEPTLAGLHCRTRVYVCLFGYMRPCTENLNRTNGNEGTRIHFKITHMLILFNVLCNGLTEYDRGLTV